MAASTVLSRLQCTQSAQQLNDDLAKMGSKYRIRTTVQSPRIQIRAIHSFEDGSKIRTAQLYAERPGDLTKAFRLCLEMDETANPLTLIQTKAVDDGPVFSAWAAVVERLKAHLDAKNIKWKGQAYDSHMREIKFWRGQVSPERLMRWVEASKSQTHDRVRRLCTLNALILCCELEVPNRWLAQMKDQTSFSITQQAVNPRTIPSDAAIEYFVDSIKYRPWQVAFGFIAGYGLRPHEVFCIESLDEDGYLEVLSKKTGLRTVLPQNRHWIERWNLNTEELPPHNPNHNGKDLGARVTTQFARYRKDAETMWRGAQSQCYDLRHAYAQRFHTRLEQFGQYRLDQMAKYMGHSEKIHRQTYMRWIDKNEMKAAAKRIERIYG